MVCCSDGSVRQCVAVCGSVAICGSVWQFVVVCSSVWQCVAVCGSVWQCVAVCSSVWQCVAACGSASQSVAVCCSLLQSVAICCRLHDVFAPPSPPAPRPTLVPTAKRRGMRTASQSRMRSHALQYSATLCKTVQYTATHSNLPEEEE